MNSLAEKFGSALVILGFPCGQFGHQEIGTDAEIKLCLKYVRPGNNFEPQFPLLRKGDVNGANAQPVWQFLRACLPYPTDRDPEKDMKEPYGVMKACNNILYDPRSPSDILWNFEKILVDKHGVPKLRFSPKFNTCNLQSHIEELLKEEEVYRAQE